MQFGSYLLILSEVGIVGLGHHLLKFCSYGLEWLGLITVAQDSIISSMLLPLICIYVTTYRNLCDFLMNVTLLCCSVGVHTLPTVVIGSKILVVVYGEFC